MRDYLWHYKHQKTVRIRRQRRFTAQKSPVRCRRTTDRNPRLFGRAPITIAWPGPVSTPPPAPALLPSLRPSSGASERARGPKQIIIMPQECHLQPINSNSVQFCRPPPPETNEWASGLAAAKQYAYGAAAAASEVRVPLDRRQTAAEV